MHFLTLLAPITAVEIKLLLQHYFKIYFSLFDGLVAVIFFFCHCFFESFSILKHDFHCSSVRWVHRCQLLHKIKLILYPSICYLYPLIYIWSPRGLLEPIPTVFGQMERIQPGKITSSKKSFLNRYCSLAVIFGSEHHVYVTVL